MDVSAHDAYLDGYLALVDRLDDETRAKVGPGYAFIFKYLYPRVYGLRKGGGAGQATGSVASMTPAPSSAVKLSNPSPGVLAIDAGDTPYIFGCDVFRTSNGKDEKIMAVGTKGTMYHVDATVAGKRFSIRCQDGKGNWSPETTLVV